MPRKSYILSNPARHIDPNVSVCSLLPHYSAYLLAVVGKMLALDSAC